LEIKDGKDILRTKNPIQIFVLKNRQLQQRVQSAKESRQSPSIYFDFISYFFRSYLLEN
jgi:hypothetical protein